MTEVRGQKPNVRSQMSRLGSLVTSFFVVLLLVLALALVVVLVLEWLKGNVLQ
jgi:hypothetical protein